MNVWLKVGLKMLIENPDSKDAYDDLLWRITTSSIADLSELIQNPWDSEYSSKIPVPLLAVAARIVILSSASNTAIANEAKAWLTMHCDPVEEKGALDGVHV